MCNNILLKSYLNIFIQTHYVTQILVDAQGNRELGNEVSRVRRANRRILAEWIAFLETDDTAKCSLVTLESKIEPNSSGKRKSSVTHVSRA